MMTVDQLYRARLEKDKGWDGMSESERVAFVAIYLRDTMGPAEHLRRISQAIEERLSI